MQQARYPHPLVLLPQLPPSPLAWAMSSQPSDHTAWGLPTDARNNNLHPLPNHPSPMNPCGPPYPQRHPPSQSNANAVQPHIPTPSSRKRQFRFSVRADIELLKLVVNMNPYGAAHGGRLQKWQAIADTLREGGIDIDFRRARDRTSLLLEQWREKDMSLLRRSGSGNHEDQVQKEQLLDQISAIEQAAKPRDNVNDWRRVESSIRHRSQPPTITQSSTSGSDNPSNQPNLNVMTVPPARPTSFGTFSTGLNPPGQLPPLVQKHNQHDLPQTRADSEIQGSALFATHQSQPPEKHFKTNQGKVLSPRFSQPLFGAPQTPPQPLPLHTQPRDGISPQRAELTGFRNDIPPLVRQSQPLRSSNQNILGNPSLDGTAPHAVTNSPRIGEGQNIQLNPQAPSLSGQGPQVDTAHLYSLFKALERRFDEELMMSRKRLEYDERRLEYEKERENKRLSLERERINKEFEDRKAEREERRTREQRDKEERDAMLQMIMRVHDQPMSDGDNPRQA